MITQNGWFNTIVDTVTIRRIREEMLTLCGRVIFDFIPDDWASLTFSNNRARYRMIILEWFTLHNTD